MKKFIFAIVLLMCYSTAHSNQFVYEEVQIRTDDENIDSVICIRTSGKSGDAGVSCNWDAYNAGIQARHSANMLINKLKAQAIMFTINEEIQNEFMINQIEIFDNIFDKEFSEVFESE